MVSYSSILALVRRPDERNQPKVGYASPGEHRAGEGSSLTQRNQLFLDYVSERCDRGQLRLEYDSVTFKRNLVFPSTRALKLRASMLSSSSAINVEKTPEPTRALKPVTAKPHLAAHEIVEKTPEPTRALKLG